MSTKRPKRPSSKRKKHPQNNAQADVLYKLGLEAFWTTPLDPASMLDISTWTLENQAPLELKDLPTAFLQSLWLLSPDARNACCKPLHDTFDHEEMNGFGESQCAINPLDLITALFMSANMFLQQEMTGRMIQCQFAVPLILPNIDPEEPSRFLLWPTRGVVSKWRSHYPDNNMIEEEGDLASTYMPIVSCVKLGRCSVSKSQVLNIVIGSQSDTFLHRGMAGGHLPRRLSNGLVEIGWYLPMGNTAVDIFPVPLIISNLRGDASKHEKHLSLLCQVSSVVVVFCGNLKEKEKQLVASCKEKASKVILIDVSYTEKNENRTVGFVDQTFDEDLGPPRGSAQQSEALSEEELANRLCDTLKDLLPDQLKFGTLEGAAKLAEEQGLHVDEGAVCKKAMVTVEGVLKGLDQGSTQFTEKQLPLQGLWWSKLAKIGKDERKNRQEGKEMDPQLQKEKEDILVELRSYKMTQTMRMFTDALFTTDKEERTCFISWMRLKLRVMQSESQHRPQYQFTNLQTEQQENGMLEPSQELENGTNDDLWDSENEELPGNSELQVSEQHMVPNEEEIQEEDINNKVHFTERVSDPLYEDQNYHSASVENGTDSTSVQQQTGQESCSKPFESDPSSLGLQHFLREMGLIFELTHTSPSSQNVLSLPSLATDLLLYGVPLELMDGDASNIPMHWLGCVFAELKRRLPQEHCRTRVLTNLGVHHCRNSEVLSALFGVKFPEGRKRSTRGVYMLPLLLPDNLRKDLECDLLLLIDVEGLCSSKERNTLNNDNELATVATGLSDVLMYNISSHADAELEKNFTVIVNALMRIKESGSMPICQLLAQDEGLKCVLQVSQLRRLSDMLQTETGDRAKNHGDDRPAKTTSCVNLVKGPWCNMSISEPTDTHYSKAVLDLKQNLFEALKKCNGKSGAKGLPEFMGRLCGVWDAVQAQSFSIGLQDTDVALALSLLCTEFSLWEDSFLEHMEGWLISAKTRIFATKAKALDPGMQIGLLIEMKDEAREEVKNEVNKLRTKVETYLMKDVHLGINTFKPVLLTNMDNLQERVTEEMIQRLEVVNESHCSSTQLKNFETLLETEKEFKLQALIENSKSTKVLLQEAEVEEEFEGVWSKVLSNFVFRPSEADDITARVFNILKENLISRGLQKHMKKLEVFNQKQTSSFYVYDEHFGYRSRLKHMFEDNNRLQRLEAQQLASNIIEEYNQFVANKTSPPADFSDSYIIDILENVEKALKNKSMEMRSAFEVDLKVHLCSAACQDFQKLHDLYAKDRELLTSISVTKGMYLAEFSYQFRKRDQCHRVAEAFTFMVIKPTVLNYVNKPLGMRIVDEIQSEVPQYQSRGTFHQSLLEELIKEESFESFMEYLHSYDNFSLRKIQEAVVAHLSESTNLDKWRQQRLGEIVGKIAAAVSETAEGTNGVLSDTKPLLEGVCLTLEKDGDVEVTRAFMGGPFFSITTEWDCFVTCLMELLATLRLDLAKEFSQSVDITQFFECLSIEPHKSLFNRLTGCDKQCPLCCAPCDLDEIGHEVHRALLHRPGGMMPHKSCSLSDTSGHETLINSKDKDDISVYPDWSISSEDPNSHTPSVYWRYVLARFNERFAEEYAQEPAEIPEAWKKITKKEALYSLKEAFSVQC